MKLRAVFWVLRVLCLSIFFITASEASAVWYPIIDDSFVRSNTSTGGAGTTTGAGNNWTDTFGGVWNIDNNTLQGFSNTSSDFTSKFLLRPTSENVLDQRVVATIPTGQNFGQFLGVALRHQPGTNNYYLAHMSGTGVFIYRVVGGTATLLSNNNGLSLSNENSYSIDFSAIGTNSTALQLVLTNLTTSTVVTTINATDSSASLQTTGRMGLTNWYNSGTTTKQVSRVQTYSGSPVYNLAITGANSLSGDIGIPMNITDLQITGDYPTTTPVKLLVSNGTLAMSTTTGLTFTGGQTGSTLYFSGTIANINNALATLSYTRIGGGSDTLEVSLVPQGEVFFADTGHLYEYISNTLTWSSAKTAAEGLTKYGATGYLTTIGSLAENDFVAERLSNAGWMGASDSISEGIWRWVTGPENGTQFWSGASGGNTVNGQYANWGTGEPNDAGGEDCAQFLAGGSGKWNDLPCTVTTLPGYVVEYGAPDNLPTVVAKNISISTSDNTAPVITNVSEENVGTFSTGQIINIFVDINEVVSVEDAMPTIALLMGDDTVYAEYYSTVTPGDGTSTLLFGYEVQAEDTDSNGITVISPILLNGATIRDASGNNTILTFTNNHIDGLLVNPDTTDPILTVISSPSGNVYIENTTTYFTTDESCTPLSESPLSNTGDVEMLISTPLPDTTITANISGIRVGGTYSVSFLCQDHAGNSSNLVTVGPFTVIPGPTLSRSTIPLAVLQKLSDEMRSRTNLNTETPPSDSFVFNIDMKKGSKIPDVKHLQILLQSKGFFPKTVETNGYFGPTTYKAVIKFQETYTDEILKPINAKKGTGVVGMYTRVKLNQFLNQ